MINFIKGILLEKQPPELVVEVQGIGYEVTASMNTFYDLPAIGQLVKIPTYLIIREDAHQLYGFRDPKERSLFKLLLKVSGVGPKMAITLLSSIDADAFVNCVHSNDIDALVRLPGIGKKTAERLILEMRDRLNDWTSGVNLKDRSMMSATQAEQDAVSALIALGYKHPEAKRAINSVMETGLSSEALIRLALKYLAK